MHDIQQEPIQLKTQLPLRPEGKALMERHGCLVEQGHVILPVGSTRQFCWQIVTITTWYEIILPDRYRMLEAYDWRQEVSMLYLSSQEEEGKGRNDGRRGTP